MDTKYAFRPASDIRRKTAQMSDQPLGRSEFLRQLAAAIAIGNGRWALGESPPSPIAHELSPAAAATAPGAPDPLVGIQMGPHTMLDEGIEHVMDLCQETASIDTLFTYCH